MNTYSGQPLLVEAPGLAQRLECEMVRQKVGLRQLAQDSGVDKATILEWKKGRRQKVKVETVRKVAKELGTTAEALLDLPPPSEAEPPQTAELLRRVASLEPAMLSELEQTLPHLREIVEEARRAGP